MPQGDLFMTCKVNLRYCTVLKGSTTNGLACVSSM